MPLMMRVSYHFPKLACSLLVNRIPQSQLSVIVLEDDLLIALTLISFRYNCRVISRIYRFACSHTLRLVISFLIRICLIFIK